MIENPLVSIVTPVRNGSRYLELCVQSVLGQSYPYIEHIIVDGGSTDGTLELLADYHARYPDRIRFISGPDNGVGDAVNKGFTMARGEVFGWIDSDDRYEPDAIRTIIEFFRSNPDAHFVFGECNIIDGEDKVIGRFPIKDFDLNEAVNQRHYIVFCSTFYRSEVVQKAGFFNILGNDLDFWLRVAQHFKLYRIGSTLCNWRLHKESLSAARGGTGRRTIRQRLHEGYLLCRQYGGSIFARRCLRYFLWTALDNLGLYHFLNFVVLEKLRSHPITNKLLRIVGAEERILLRKNGKDWS